MVFQDVVTIFPRYFCWVELRTVAMVYRGWLGLLVRHPKGSWLHVLGFIPWEFDRESVRVLVEALARLSHAP